MLRIYFLQQWFNLSDPAVEEALYDSPLMREFVGIDLGREPVPDETTVCKFRHLLEEHQIGAAMLETVNQHLQKKGVRIATGTIVDATIIHAPSSTKNREQERDPEMHQTKKGKQWYFGMKAHVGVDSKTKLIHSAVATAANVADSTVLPELLHGEETKVWGDQAYRGQTEAIHEVRATGAGPDQPTLSLQRPHRRRRARAQPDEVAGALQGGARVSDHEAEVRVREGALPRTREERQPAVCHLRPGQPLHRPLDTAAAGAGISPPQASVRRSFAGGSRERRTTIGTENRNYNLPRP